MGAANHLQVLDDPPWTQGSQSLGDVGAFVSLLIHSNPTIGQADFAPYVFHVVYW